MAFFRWIVCSVFVIKSVPHFCKTHTKYQNVFYHTCFPRLTKTPVFTIYTVFHAGICLQQFCIPKCSLQMAVLEAILALFPTHDPPPKSHHVWLNFSCSSRLRTAPQAWVKVEELILIVLFYRCVTDLWPRI